MKVHTNNFKKEIKEFGRQFDTIISYTEGNEMVELGGDDLNSITINYEGGILKSVMREVDIDTNVEIPIGKTFNIQYGVVVGEEENQQTGEITDIYEYINFGDFIVKESEKQEDTESYKLKCYDKMLLSMIDYETPKQLSEDTTFTENKAYFEYNEGKYVLYEGERTGNPTQLNLYENITYPITIHNYITAVCNHLGLTFKNEGELFVNYDKTINNELYIANDGNSINYTFRDVFDDLAEVTASTICINEDDNELEIRYINDTSPNIIDPSSIEQKTENGITCTYNDETQEITLNGTCTDTTYFDFSDTFKSSRKSGVIYPQITGYYYGGEVTGNATLDDGNNAITLSDFDEENNVISIRPTRVQQTNYFGFTFNNGDIADNFKIKVMVNNEVLDEYEVRDTIDGEYLSDTKVDFSEKFGPINSIVLSRAAGADNIYIHDDESIEEYGLCEIKISDNEIMNFNDRDTYLPDILEQLDGLEFYLNDYNSTGICYYNVCDKYNVEITRVDEETEQETTTIYPCIMFNDEVIIDQGLEENVFTKVPDGTQTDYKNAAKTDQMINKAYIIAKKNDSEIESLTSVMAETEETVEQVVQNVTGLTNNFIKNGGTNLFFNTGLHFKDDQGNFTYWVVEPNTSDDYLGVVSDSESLSGTDIILPNGKVNQTINTTIGEYCCSFYYKKNIPTANCYVTINGIRTKLGNETEWTKNDTETQILNVSGDNLTIEFECDVQGGYYIKELMLNRGTEPIEYTQNINETRTDTVQISNGILVSSSSTNTESRHDSDGFRILRKDNQEIVLRATENGTETTSIKASNDSEIAGLIIKKYQGHVLMSGKGDE